MRVKQFLTAALLAGLLALLLAAPAAAAAKIGIVLDGEELTADPAPRMVNGRVLVPLRVVAEGLHAGASYSPSGGGEVTVATAEGTEIVLKIGSKEAVKDTHREGGRQVLKLDVPARIYNGYTYVPLRFVAEALGAKVDWQAAKQQVIITPGEFIDPDPIFVNNEGKELHSMTTHTYMTMGGWLYGYWGHKQVGEAWRLLVESRGREVPEPELPYSRIMNMDWNYFYYLDREVGFYAGDPVYDQHGDETADYFFKIYTFEVIYDDGSVQVPGDNEGKYLLYDTGTDKWYILPAANYDAFMELKFPSTKQLVNNIV